MKFTVNIYFDDQDGSFVSENYFINGNQVSKQEYDVLIEEYEMNEENCNENDNFDECNGCEEVVCEYCDDCEDCEIPADMCVDIHIVEELASEFEESDCQCRSCLRNTIYNALVRGKSMGWDDCRLSLIEALSDD